VRFRVSIAIGGILLLLSAAATAPATTATRIPSRVTIVAPKLAQSGEIVRVNGTVKGASWSLRWVSAPVLFRVSESGSTIRKKIIRAHEGRFRTWTRFSKPGVYRVSVSYPGDSSRLPSSASVTIRVT
jgi:hypothetical protein